VNKGKYTPGIDKLVVKTPEARAQLVEDLRNTHPWRVQPVRRVYIPKPNGKRRPLGIPSIRDRALQAVVRNALEPEWEAKFEGCSYGFRPGRSCHDAIAKLFNLCRGGLPKQWIVDADIQGAFDHIAHRPLLCALGLFPGRRLIAQWLKAGVVEGTTFHPTEEGSPQGGVVSPLLMNIALHGMETALGITYHPNGVLKSARALVRYADDSVILCESEEDAKQAKEDLARWLLPRGLTLSEDKTRIVHLTEGFDYLGFNVRRYPTPQTTKAGWKLLIKPSAKSIQGFKARLRQEWRSLRGKPIRQVIQQLNPIIRGWSNYFRIGVAKDTFHTLDYWMWYRSVRWAKYMHPHKSMGWIKHRYFGPWKEGSADQWVFGDGQRRGYLLRLAWTPIRRHILVKGRSSPDDPALQDYWQERRGKQYLTLPKVQQGYAKWQNGRCWHCGTSLYNDEELHIHHLVPRSRGGSDAPSNKRLVHLLCHQQIHAKMSPV
jgi:RNA-directed DNA polymerase